MKPPRFAKDHPDRIFDLEEHLEPFVYASMNAALQAGYDCREVEVAVMHLALNFARMIDANKETDRAVSAARRKAAH